jgi:hypothetical protein
MKWVKKTSLEIPSSIYTRRLYLPDRMRKQEKGVNKRKEKTKEKKRSQEKVIRQKRER